MSAPDWLISFIDLQQINRLYIMMEELAGEDSPPTISTRIQNSHTWYIWSICNYKHLKEGPKKAKARSEVSDDTLIFPVSGAQ
jgi:hypothetical protein